VTDPDVPSPFDSAVATRRGDDGTTGLLFGGERIAKDDLRTEAYGTIDEAVAALGLARAALGRDGAALELAIGDLAAIILEIQRDLFVAAAELATQPATRRRRASSCRPSSSCRARPWSARRSSWPGRSSAAPSGGR
jgi:cob(I)alamin adenosyltransferase